ncbi:histidine-containing phosphotransfer protein 1-like [Apium graveolens]|uniref:histidine-containing phosphotransfer protein 1-like n=1 Tax=Apium graveolens TaxID=4045 RepID=UPI003D7A146E
MSVSFCYLFIEHKNVNRELNDAVHRLKGSSTSIGAKKVTTLCLAFEDHYSTQNYEACLQCLPKMKEEYVFVKNKLETVCSLQQQIIGAGGSVPILG